MSVYINGCYLAELAGLLSFISNAPGKPRPSSMADTLRLCHTRVPQLGTGEVLILAVQDKLPISFKNHCLSFLLFYNIFFSQILL